MKGGVATDTELKQHNKTREEKNRRIKQSNGERKNLGKGRKVKKKKKEKTFRGLALRKVKYSFLKFSFRFQIKLAKFTTSSAPACEKELRRRLYLLDCSFY